MKNKKIINWLFSATVLLPIVGFSTSCNKHNFDLSWSGDVETFKQDYKQFSDPQIKLNDTLTTYLSRPNTKQMLIQDFGYTICQSSVGYSYLSINLDIDSFKNNRLSFYWKIQDIDHKNIYEMLVSNLEYYPQFDANWNLLYFLPKNVSISNQTIIVDDHFWTDDINFVIKVNDYKFSRTYEFSWRCWDDDDRFQFSDTFVSYLVFQPYFYENTQIVE